MRTNEKKVAFLAIGVVLALILAYLESLLPPLLSRIPGIKIGLPNIVIIFALYRFGLPEAVVISGLRIVMVLLLFGSPLTFAYSVAGATLSMVVMYFLKKTELLSMVGVSVAGGVMHNVGQIIMAMFLLGTAEIGYYMIILAITGTISGILVGVCSSLILKRVDIKV